MSSYFRPEQLAVSWVEFSGPNAREYLHRLSTVDARALTPGKGAPGLFLNAQGRIQGSFRLWCLEQDRFAFEVESGSDGRLKKGLLDWIEQYHFGEKFEVRESGLASLWVLGGEAEQVAALPGEWTTVAGAGLRVCHEGSSQYGRPLLSIWGEHAAVEGWLRERLPEAREVSLETLEGWRIQALTPRSGYELGPDANPLEAGIASAIAMNKGCYPGQEVIEKTISLGQPAQRLCRLEGEGPVPAPGEILSNQADPPVGVGRITSSVASGAGFEALGYVRKIQAKEGAELRLASGRMVRITAVSTLALPA